MVRRAVELSSLERSTMSIWISLKHQALHVLQLAEAPSSQFAARRVQLTQDAVLDLLVLVVLLLRARQPLVYVAVDHLQAAVHGLRDVEVADLVQSGASGVLPADQSVHRVCVGGLRVELGDTRHGRFDLIQQEVAQRIDVVY